MADAQLEGEEIKLQPDLINALQPMRRTLNRIKKGFLDAHDNDSWKLLVDELLKLKVKPEWAKLLREEVLPFSLSLQSVLSSSPEHKIVDSKLVDTKQTYDILNPFSFKKEQKDNITEERKRERVTH